MVELLLCLSSGGSREGERETVSGCGVWDAYGMLFLRPM